MGDKYEVIEKTALEMGPTSGKVIKFRPYPFEPGQKIFIEGGPRRGDWEVIGVDEKNVKLRCPITGKEVEWARFCYFSETVEGAVWPHPD